MAGAGWRIGAAVAAGLIAAGCESDVRLTVNNETPAPLRCRAWLPESGYELSLVSPSASPRDGGDSAAFHLQPGGRVERVLRQRSAFKAPTVSPVCLRVEGAQPEDGIERIWRMSLSGSGPFLVRITAPEGRLVFERVDAEGQPFLSDSVTLLKVRRRGYP